MPIQRPRTFANMAADASFDNLARQFGHLPLIDRFPNCFPDINPVDVYRSHITSILHDITGVDPSVIYPALQWTATLEKGDLMLAIPALRIKGKPDDLGKQWLDKTSSLTADFQWPESPLVEKPVQSGPFIPFFFKAGPLAKTVIPMALSHRADFGTNNSVGLKDLQNPDKGRQRMIVEFSSPNIAKPFHAGHLRSTIIGGFLSNLYKSAGYDVIAINYLGDWGKQYGVLALGFEKYGNETDLEQDPINHLFQVYVKISRDVKDEKDQADKLKAEGKEDEAKKLLDEGLDEQARKYFKKMTEGDEEALALWRRFRDFSIERYKKTYARLNIHFDEYSGESKVSEDDMYEAANKLKDLGVAEEHDGALLIDFVKSVPGKEGKQLGKAILRKKDGTALYLTRDISELLNREKKYHFDRMIYVIASEQDLHVKQFFKVVGMMGHKDIADKCQHINFGLVLGMSTRKGTVKFLDDILRDVGDHMHEVMKKNEEKYSQVDDPAKTADVLGISSINNYTFDLQRMTSFEGDTGPYLQYAHARLCSITRKAGLSAEEISTADLSLLTEPMATNLIRVVCQWPDVVSNTLRTLEPTTILTYLFKMTHILSTSYSHLRIVGSEPEVMKARMALYDSARVVLHNGMVLLGLTPLDRM
ncbi:arginyl-tRNA synthetase [Purpureocillium lavendulum]|uniref:arginine--tRNA ligase n=1 Tax=Purpureocillium lavendulum TaxID=1247861 RepID=A0AB34FUC2_9HYPO|nr:arginyl-tRNA synthetase [Purpureocillium lavendulum]